MEDEKVPVCEETFDWIRKVTTEFYELVYKDPWFSKIFSKVEQKIITSQQIDFMIQKFGGPKRFCGSCLRPLHRTRARLPAELLRSRSAQRNKGTVRQLNERTITCIRL